MKEANLVMKTLLKVIIDFSYYCGIIRPSTKPRGEPITMAQRLIGISLMLLACAMFLCGAGMLPFQEQVKEWTAVAVTRTIGMSYEDLMGFLRVLSAIVALLAFVQLFHPNTTPQAKYGRKRY